MKKLLVMDDQTDVCAFVKDRLGEKDWEILGSTTVKDAISLAEKEKPAVIILDVMMRKSSPQNREGITALKEIRKICPKSMIIMITGVNDHDVIEETKKLGADKYITKPLVLEDLQDMIKNVA